MKIQIGVNRKIGEPSFGSRGASMSLEVELDIALLQDTDQLRERVRRLYQLARQSVDEELRRPNRGSSTIVSVKPPAPNVVGWRSTSEQTVRASHLLPRHVEPWPWQKASPGQIRAIFAITKRQGLDANAIIRDRCGVFRMEHLTMREASSLIDELQNPSSVPC